MSNENNVQSEITKYKTKRGEIEAYLAKPEGIDGPHPAIIVIHEIFGLVDHTKDVANRFARKGYVALAPHLFSDPDLSSTLSPSNIGVTMNFVNSLPPGKRMDMGYVQAELAKYPQDQRNTIQKTMGTLFGGLPMDKLTYDLVSAVDYLNSRKDVRHGKVGSVGFCFGGGMSINLACHAKTAACVVFYGANPSPIDLVKNIEGPVLGLYGGEDTRVNSGLGDLVKAMAQYKKDFEMKIYPGAFHAFFNDTNKNTYNESAAKDAWERVLRFYQRTLLET